MSTNERWELLLARRRELAPDEEVAVQEHLATCPTCRITAATYTTQDDVLQLLRATTLGESVQERVRDAIAHQSVGAYGIRPAISADQGAAICATRSRADTLDNEAHGPHEPVAVVGRGPRPKGLVQVQGSKFNVQRPVWREILPKTVIVLHNVRVVRALGYVRTLVLMGRGWLGRQHARRGALVAGLALALMALLVVPALMRGSHPTRLVAPVAHAGSFTALPLAFEVNRGQAPSSARFTANSDGFRLLLGAAGPVILAADTAGRLRTIRLQFVHTSAHRRLIGLDPLPGRVNYVIGDDPHAWLSDVPTYARVEYRDIYRGVNLVFHGSGSRLEYDLALGAGVDPGMVELRVRGVSGMRLDASGAMLLRSGGVTIRQDAPIVRQRQGNRIKRIPVRYVLRDGIVRLRLGRYDHHLPLTVDPVFEYATYLGGSGPDTVGGVAVDAAGNVYLAGATHSANLPGAHRHTPVRGYWDAYVTKLAPDGHTVLYTTYLGGAGSEGANGIAVDGRGDAYVAGQTTSPDFPLAHAVDPTFNRGRPCHSANACTDAFVAELSPDGAKLRFSTYYGGNGEDMANAIALDRHNAIYLTGQTHSTDFPLVHALQRHFRGGPPGWGGGDESFVAKLSPGGRRIDYSSYLGGRGTGEAGGIAVDAAGDVYVTGETNSYNFPTVNAFQRHPHIPPHVGLLNDAYGNAYIVKLNPTGTRLLYSTYLGGDFRDAATAIAIDGAGDAYVTGTTSSNNFPTVHSLQPFDRNGRPSHGSLPTDVFVAELSASGRHLVFSSYLGSSDTETSGGIGLDGHGDIFVAGMTNSPQFPVFNAMQPRFGGGTDAFLAEWSPGGRRLKYSTFVGGKQLDVGTALAVDKAGNAYLAGMTGQQYYLGAFYEGRQKAFSGRISPKTSARGCCPVYQLGALKAGPEHAFVAKIAPGAAYTGPTATPFPTLTPTPTVTPTPTPLPPVPAGHTVSNVVGGLKLSLHVPRASYPKDALIRVVASVQNVSSASITITSPSCPQPPWVVTVTRVGKLVPQPVFDYAGGPLCSRPPTVTVRPGKIIARPQYVYLHTGYLRPAVANSYSNSIDGRLTRIHLTASAVPRIAVRRTDSAIDITLRRTVSAHGPLIYGYVEECVGGGAITGLKWRTTRGDTLVVRRDPRCDPEQSWSVRGIAGWEGERVAVFNLVDRHRVPCELTSNVPAGHPVVPADVNSRDLAATGITLVAPRAHARICGARIVAEALSGNPEDTSVAGPVLAYVRDRHDPLISGRLAWVATYVRRWPGRTQVDHVLEFVDARTGKLLELVYAGGNGLVKPPVHLRSIRLAPFLIQNLVIERPLSRPKLTLDQALRHMFRNLRVARADVVEAALVEAHNLGQPYGGTLAWVVVLKGIMPMPGLEIFFFDANTGRFMVGFGAEGGVATQQPPTPRPTASPAAPRIHTVSSVVGGLKLTLTVWGASYPQDALVRLVASVQNVSHKTITVTSPGCPPIPWVETVTASSAIVRQPTFDFAPGTPCAPEPTIRLKPDQSLTRSQYVYLQTNLLRVAVGDSNSHWIVGRRIQVQFVRGVAPKVTVQRTASIVSITVHRPAPARGPMIYGFDDSCSDDALQSGLDWRTSYRTRLTLHRLPQCDPSKPWSVLVIAGWEGRRAVRINMVDRLPPPCVRAAPGTPGYLAAPAPISLQTMRAMRINLVVPRGRTGICGSRAVYVGTYRLGGFISTIGSPLLAWVQSPVDPLVAHHLAWVVPFASRDPNHPHAPLSHFLSFVDARSGASLDIVYAGGLGPVTPPLHLRTVSERLLLSDFSVTLAQPLFKPKFSHAALLRLLRCPSKQCPAREIVLAEVHSWQSERRSNLLWVIVQKHQNTMYRLFVQLVDATTGKDAGGFGILR